MARCASPVDFSGKENYLKKCLNSTEEEVYHQKSDLGCVICWRTSFVNWGADTGIKLKTCSVCNGPRFYCSSHCFKIDWNKYNHKDECKRLTAQVTFDDPTTEAAKIQVVYQMNKMFSRVWVHADPSKIFANVRLLDDR